jgi:hypothetical protein
MTSDQQKDNAFFRRPLYVFDLPQELLLSLTLTSATSVISSEEPQHQTNSDQLPKSHDDESQSMACSLCGLKFAIVADQRQHTKSDFHRYNLKLSLKHLPAVDEATFIRQIGELDESISGSESSDSEEDGSGERDPLSVLLRKKATLRQTGVAESSSPTNITVPHHSPMIWFSSTLSATDEVWGAYRAIFPSKELAKPDFSALDYVRAHQLRPVASKHSGHGSSKDVQRPTRADPHYFLCMIGGGHFAAMVVSLVPEIRRGAGGTEERHPVVLAHKTFHRYTTRRKQGGSQSTNDNAKGNAHSVGSSIRRANEAALEAEVRGVLSDWQLLIESAELLFIRATGSTNRRTLLGPYDGQVLNSKDDRLRSIPFTTRRATQAELLRAFQELTRLKLTRREQQSVNRQDQPSTKPQTHKPQPEKVKLSREDEEALLHTTQVQGLVRRSKVPGVLLYLQKNSLSPNFLFFPPMEHRHAPTMLHLAASTNSTALVSALLMKVGADPTISNPDGKTAYDLAGDKRTRDAFRIARHDLGEAAFDWAAAHVPSGISHTEAEARAQQERNQEGRQEMERRKADLEQIRQQEEAASVQRTENKYGGGKTLVSQPEKTGVDRREEEARGLTPELRMKLERERRARAAENRLRLQGS